jgi:uncharacterized SAM-binding protein YcdF (DUF218 family)
MFFILSKVLNFLLTPIVWILALLIFGALSKKPGRKKGLLFSGIILLIFMSNPAILNFVMNGWEIPAIPYNETEKHNIGILLTGVTRPFNEPKDRVYFNKGADRVTHTVQLYKLGKINKIVVSGGSGLLNNTAGDVESENIRQVLLLCGIPDSVIILEVKSRNTYENALFSKEILKSYPGEKYLLITSSFHMRRSIACFEKQGLKVTPFPVDFYTEDQTFRLVYLFPSEFALMEWRILLREIFGMITYKIAGYI